jgi:hypothetical protein
MLQSQIRLSVLLPNSPLNAEAGSKARLQVTLTSLGGQFDLQPIAGRIEDGQLIQWFLQYEGTLKATLELFLGRSDGEAPLRDSQEFIQALNLVLGAVEEDTEPLRATLLQGSLAIPVAGLSNNNLWQEVKKLWPTEQQIDIQAFLIEPAGLYIQGTLPASFFAPERARRNPDKLLILRVPQQWGDEDAGVNLETSDAERCRFWSLGAFPFQNSLTASEFIRDYGQAIKTFRPSDKSFIDNLICEPQPDCIVRIFRDDNYLKWIAGNFRVVQVEVANDSASPKFKWVVDDFLIQNQNPATVGETIASLRREGVTFSTDANVQTTNQPAGSLATRIMLGTGTTSEVPFYPSWLRGAVNLETQQREVVCFEATTDSSANWRQMEEGEIALELRGAGDAQDTQFQFPKQNLVALSSMPSSPIIDQKKLETAAMADTVEPTINESRASYYRAWLCTDTGWLSVDATVTDVQIDPKKESQGAVTATIPISEIVSQLQPPPQNHLGIAGIVRATRLELTVLRGTYVAICLNQRSDSASEASLSLLVDQPMITLTTAALWFNAIANTSPDDPKQPRPLTATQIPSLTPALLDPNTSNPELIASTFISENVVDSPDQIPEAVLIQVQYDSESRMFEYSFHANQTTVWYRPPGLPLVQTFPISPTVTPSVFLDANRGLIPYRFTDEQPWIVLRFPLHRLPYLKNPPPTPVPNENQAVQNSWKVVPQFGESRWFLPTLPGVEATVGQNRHTFTWSYRHAVPALDEAYSEVTEVPNASRVKPHYSGIDFTRVFGTVAFTFGDGEASGLLHKTDANSTGSVPLELSNISLTGTEPQIQLKLDNEDRALRRSPREPGLGELGLRVTLDSTAPAYRFTVEPSANDADLKIIQHGQPLIARWHEGRQRVVTLDGEGRIREESVDAQIRSRILQGENYRDRTQHTAFYELSDDTLQDKLRLDLSGISAVNDFRDLTAAELERESWMLHNGSGEYPLLRGFPLYPLKLVSYQPGEPATIVLEAIYLPRLPEQNEEPTDFATDVVELTFEGQNEKLTLIGLSGSIDWCFRQPSRPSQPYLFRLNAKVLLEGTEVTLAYQEIAFEHPDLGLMRLTDLNARGSVNPSTLLNQSISLTLEKHYEVKLTYDLHADLLAESPIVPLTSLSCEWSGISSKSAKLDYAQNVNWKLVSNSRSGEELSWKLHLYQDDRILVENLSLKLSQVDPWRFIFQVTKSEVTLPNKGWFKTEMKDGFVGVEFQNSNSTTHLLVKNLVVNLQLDLKDRKPNDAIQVWDTREKTLRSLDRQTCEIGWVISPKLAESDPEDEDIYYGESNPEAGDPAYRKWNLETNQNSSVKVDWNIRAGQVVPIRDSESWVVFVDSSQAIRTWDLETNGQFEIEQETVPTVLEAAATPVSAIASSGGSLIAWARGDDQIQLWPVKGGSPMLQPPISSGGGAIIALAFRKGNLNEDQIVLGTRTGVLQVRDPKLAEPTFTRKDDNREIMSVTVLEDRHRRIVASYYANGTSKLRLWNPPSEQSLAAPETDSALVNELDLPGRVEQIVSLGQQRIFDGNLSPLLAVLVKDGGTSSVVQYVIHNDQILQAKILTAHPFSPTAIGVQKVKDDNRYRLIMVGSTARTHLWGLLQYQYQPEETIANLEVMGRLLLHNAIPLKDTKERDCYHRLDAYLDKAVLPLSAVFYNQGPEQEHLVGAIAEHTLRLGNGKELCWQVPQVIRLVQVQKIAADLELSPIEENQRNALVIDAGTSFWLQVPDQSRKSELRKGTLKIENTKFRLLLQPQEVGVFAANQATVVQLPFLAGSSLPKISKIQLQESAKTTSTTGVQSSIPAPASFTTTSGQITYFNRTTQFNWLNSHYLCTRLLPTRDGQVSAAPYPLLLFGTGDLPEHKLPSRLSVLPTLNQPQSDYPNIYYLQAAAIAYPSSPDPSEESHLFEFPFWIRQEVIQPPNSNITHHTQLIEFTGTQFSCIAATYTSPEATTSSEEWAKQVLDTRQRYGSIFVLENYSTVQSISRRDDWLREELRFAQTWISDIPAAIAPDPRCCPPRSTVSLRANSALELLLFGAVPCQLPPSENSRPQIAATRFCLTQAGNSASAGQLRPAQSTNSVFALTTNEVVAFEEVVKQRYPMANMRRSPDCNLKSIFPTSETIETTVIPPLFEVVSWAARPGETMTSSWSLNHLIQGETPQTIKLEAASTTSAALRRPRALSGRNESVALDRVLPESSAKREDDFTQCFYQSTLALTQIVDETPLPEGNSIEMVIVTRTEIFLSSQGSQPVTVQRQQQVDLQNAFALYLLTNEPLSDSTFLVAQGDAGDNVPGKLTDQLKPDPALPLDKPIDILPGLPHFPGITSSVPLITDKFKEQFTGTELKTLKLSLVTYKSETDGAGIRFYQSPETRSSIVINFMEADRVVPPLKMSISVLAYPSGGDSQQTVFLSGYSRLSSDAFSTIQPIKEGDHIQWRRTVQLQTLERLSSQTELSDLAAAPYQYDVVVYGPGGEMILTRPTV